MVYTGWLEVGHIDEIAAFAPNPNGGFCILRASPKLAVDMLTRLKAEQARGVRVTRFFGEKVARTNALVVPLIHICHQTHFAE